jgi:hypothetical protein
VWAGPIKIFRSARHDLYLQNVNGTVFTFIMLKIFCITAVKVKSCNLSVRAQYSVYKL